VKIERKLIVRDKDWELTDAGMQKTEHSVAFTAWYQIYHALCNSGDDGPISYILDLYNRLAEDIATLIKT